MTPRHCLSLRLRTNRSQSESSLQAPPSTPTPLCAPHISYGLRKAEDLKRSAGVSFIPHLMRPDWFH